MMNTTRQMRTECRMCQTMCMCRGMMCCNMAVFDMRFFPDTSVSCNRRGEQTR